MSSIELTEWLARQLREALSIIEDQARLLELHGITECEGDGCTPSLSERRKDALQGGTDAISAAERDVRYAAE